MDTWRAHKLYIRFFFKIVYGLGFSGLGYGSLESASKQLHFTALYRDFLLPQFHIWHGPDSVLPLGPVPELYLVLTSFLRLQWVFFGWRTLWWSLQQNSPADPCSSLGWTVPKQTIWCVHLILSLFFPEKYVWSFSHLKLCSLSNTITNLSIEVSCCGCLGWKA